LVQQHVLTGPRRRLNANVLMSKITMTDYDHLDDVF